MVMNEVQQKIDSLEKGADDYITKPFSFEELRATNSVPSPADREK